MWIAPYMFPVARMPTKRLCLITLAAAFFFINGCKSPSQLQSFSYCRVVLSEEKFCQVQIVTGFSEIQNNHISYYTTDALCSDCIDPPSGVFQDTSKCLSSARLSDIKHYLGGYYSALGDRIWQLYRDFEEYSPLNPRQRKYFQYSISPQNDGGKAIAFSTKEASFPSKSHINGVGKIILNEDEELVYAEMRDAEIRHWNSDTPAKSIITPYTLAVRYGVSGKKKYIKDITLTVNWRMPDNPKDACFAIEESPVLNPFKNSISTITTLSFSEPCPDHYDISAARVKSEHILTGYTDHAKISLLSSVSECDSGKVLIDMQCDSATLISQTRARADRIKSDLFYAFGDNLEKQLLINRKLYDRYFE